MQFKKGKKEMLQYVNNIYLKVVSVQNKPNGVPSTVYLDMYDRSGGDLKFIGQMRFNFDPAYSKNPMEIRMSFNSFDNNTFDPLGKKLLEDIIVAVFLWITLDNHYTYMFQPRPYMVFHDYAEDSSRMHLINEATRDVLMRLECDRRDNNVYVFSKDNTSKYLSQKLAQGNRV